MTEQKASTKATTKYKKANYKRIPLEVSYPQYEQIKSSADAVGESVNGYIKKAIAMRMQSEQ